MRRRERRGPRRRLGFRAIRAGFLICLAFSTPTDPAAAICDVIPGVTAEFRGALGSLNRPFAIPNDVGQQVTITLQPARCDGESPSFLDLPGGVVPEDDYFVTVLFEPPNGAARNAVVLTTEANEETCLGRVANGLLQLGGGGATCRVVAPDTLAFDVSNAATLGFRFPDTDADLPPDGDDGTFTGPATIVVTRVSHPLPFALASSRCAEAVGAVACIDELYAHDGTCSTSRPHIDPVFGHFTALPPANDYEALCTTPGTECDGTAAELRFAVDAAGNALVPRWTGAGSSSAQTGSRYPASCEEARRSRPSWVPAPSGFPGVPSSRPTRRADGACHPSSSPWPTSPIPPT